MSPTQKIGHSLPLFGRSFIQSVSPTKDSIRPARSNLWIILLPCFALFISLSAAISLSLSARVLTSPHYFWLTLACLVMPRLLLYISFSLRSLVLTHWPFLSSILHIHQVIWICSKAFFVNENSDNVTHDLCMHRKMETCDSQSDL